MLAILTSSAEYNFILAGPIGLKFRAHVIWDVLNKKVSQNFDMLTLLRIPTPNVHKVIMRYVIHVVKLLKCFNAVSQHLGALSKY